MAYVIAIILAVFSVLKSNAANFVVTNSADFGPGTLRERIDIANTSASPPHVISFNINSPYTISISNQLPAVTNNTRIDGTTQPGYAGTPLIRLNGTNKASSVTGISLSGPGSSVRGLRIERFGGIGVSISGRTNRVEGCHVFSNNYGVSITAIGSDALIPATAASNRNVNAASILNEINIVSTNGRNTIQGNYIGVGPSGIGTFSISNNLDGIFIDDSPSNKIGGAVAGARNVIADNSSYGIFIYGDKSRGNSIEGNLIGLDATGTNSLGNANGGIIIFGAPSNTVGGAAGSRNFISGNIAKGISITGTNAYGNLIINNHIGLGTNGIAVPNSRGIEITAPDNVIQSNVISGNLAAGIHLESPDARGNDIYANIIGLNPSGTSARPNGDEGVVVRQGASSNVIGSISGSAIDRNIISGNGASGILIEHTNSSGNLIVNSLIGTDISGYLSRPNGSYGVWLNETRGNRVGDSVAGRENVISGNTNAGVRISGLEGLSNRVENNFIGPDIASTGSLAYAQPYGVIITEGGSGHSIGPGRNVISGNAINGIHVMGLATNISIVGNWVGCTALGDARLPNNQHGVFISYCTEVRVADNILSGNNQDGLRLDGNIKSNIVVTGNKIGLSAGGNAAVSNAANGIFIKNVPGAKIGGTNGVADRNIISGNGGNGIWIESGYSSTGTVIAGNYIGLNSSGNSAIPNMGDGVRAEYTHGITVGGPTTNHQNVISGNNRGVFITGSHNWTIANNYIGVNATAFTQRSNRVAGIHLYQTCYSNVIQDNLVSGNGGPGIWLDDAILDATIRGNIIGASRDNPLQGIPNAGPGILASGTERILYGGYNSADANRIAFNLGPGIAVTSTLFGYRLKNEMYGNLIYSNAGIGIDLNYDGITTNDSLDEDFEYANGLQNYPELSLAMKGSTIVQGRLISKASINPFRLEFFALVATQGMVFVGATNLSLDASGTGSFYCVFSQNVPTGSLIVATASTTNEGTSELSRPITLLDGSADADQDLMPNYWESAYGLNPGVSNPASADADFDGFPDINEWIADTLPNSSGSYFSITTMTGGAVRAVMVPSSSVRVYDLDRTESLHGPSWNTLLTNISGTGGMLGLVDTTAAGSSSVYRVRVRIP